MPKKITTQVGIRGKLTTKQLEIPDTEPAPWGAEVTTKLVGTNVTRVDGAAKVTGAAKYTHDINLPGMLYGKILRSPHPAAKVLKVDTSEAERMPGVKAVLAIATGARATVRYAGAEVAAVAATSPDLAEDALRAIKVEYETKPFVVNIAKAIRPDSPPVHEQAVQQRRTEADDSPAAAAGGPRREGNKNILGVANKGDLAKGFAEAEVVVEGTFSLEVQTHAALETHGSVAKWDGDELTVWASTQGVFSVRDGLADFFKMPRSKVRVYTEYMGGGFGAKFGPGADGITCAQLAKKAGAPVKLMLDRMEEQLASGNRPSAIMQMKLGAKRDGKITALQLISHGTGGIAGGSDPRRPMQNVYDIPNWKLEATDVFLNTGPGAAQRAPGHPQGVFGMDSIMDMMADKLGMDPLEFRKKNDPSPIRQAEYDIGAKEIGWERRNKKAGGGPVVNGKRRGMGMASSVWYALGGPGSKVDIDVHRDGTVEVRQGVQDIGTGTRTLVALVAAEELTLPLEMVTAKIGDSHMGAAPGSGGSTTAPSITPAVRAAAFAARNKMTELAAGLLGAPADQIELADGKFTVKGEATKSATWKQVAARITGSVLSASGERARNWDPWLRTNAGVQFAEVEVDVETGKVRVLKMVGVHDAGRIMNRLTCDSQVIGGMIQSLGYALMENRIIDRVTGRMVNPDLEFYKIPSAEDMPELKSIMFEAYNGHSSTEVIGLGEPPKVPGAAAIANAVFNALGVRVHSTPITPDKVLAALKAKERGSPPSDTGLATLPAYAREIAAEMSQFLLRTGKEA
jgi:xanthine dehydrogenase YagR molybdenum-binding subunit